MSFGSLSLGLGLASKPVAAAASSEKFPDPTLAHVTDATNGWNLDDGGGAITATGGAGPGLTFAAAEDGQFAVLVGTDATAFANAVTNNATVSVSITFASFTAGKLYAQIKAGSIVEFAPSGNGVVTHNVTAGTIGGDGCFSFGPAVGESSVTLNVTHISVT